jgi:cysteine synthase B
MPSITELVGQTPLVPIPFENPSVKIYGKMEGHNPGGSVKDRAALGMIRSAMERGALAPGDHLIEATSGNTGIALAMIGRQKGLQVHLVMPDNSTQERIQTMQAFGAQVLLTPASKTIEYSRTIADQWAKEKGYFQLDQFANEDNWKAHYHSTGPEIWKDTEGKITHFVSAMGTTGTIMGVGQYLKEKNPQVTIVGVQPAEGTSIPGIRRWSPAFLPKIFNPHWVDHTVDIDQETAQGQTIKNAQERGIFGGLSAGGATAAALQIAQQIEEGVIVCIICDRGDRYLSSGLFQMGPPTLVD